MSDRYAGFWKAVYERGKLINPDLKITTFFYWAIYHAPLGKVDLSDNFFGEFVQWMCKAMWFPMPEDAYNNLKKQWMGWKKTGVLMGYRPNYFWGGYVLPFLSMHQAGEFLKFTVKNGSVGWAGDRLFDDWAIKGPMFYVHMRLLNKPEMNIDDVLAEYYSAFGPAAPQVKAYFDYWEKFSHQVVEKYSWPLYALPQIVKAPNIYKPEVFTSAEKFLVKALIAARKDVRPEFAERVKFLALGLEHAKLTMSFVALLDSGKVNLSDRKRFESTQKAWKKLQSFRNKYKSIPFVDLKHHGHMEKRFIKDLKKLDQGFAQMKNGASKNTPWGEWLFRTDPKNKGVRNNWQAAAFNAKDWKPIKVPARWTQTWVKSYLGYGWYRTSFKVPADWAGKQINLHFRGVGEQAWVYVNGKLAGEHSTKSTKLGPAKLCNEPFTVKIASKLLKYGAENTLVVRVHALGYKSGIHQPIIGNSPHPEKWLPLPVRK